MSGRLEAVLAQIDSSNATDPNAIETAAGMRPAALVYGERMAARLGSFRPDASEHLQIAARAQHLERWRLPRSDYPMDRAGYLRWRNEQKRRHADRVAELMQASGYEVADRERVASLVRKERLKRDPEAQALEDVACLVFLQHYLAEFAQGRDREHLADIIAKTWRKMSDAGRQAALALPIPAEIADIVHQGVSRA